MSSLSNTVSKAITSTHPSSNVPPSPRVEWIDVAKGAGILLVVLGHVAAGAGGALYDAIYTFHMPMFFMLSGIVYRPESVKSQLPKRLLSLMLPYGCFLLVVMLMKNIFELGCGVSIDHILDSNAHQLLLDLKGGRSLKGDYGTFWFVSCLFVSLIIYNALRIRLQDPLGYPMIACIIALFLISYPLRWHSWALDASVAPLAIVFLWTGECWWALSGRNDKRSNHQIILFLSTIVAILGLCLLSPLDMKIGHYGTRVLSIIVAIAMSHLFFVGCRFMAKNSFMCALLVPFGQASLVILFVHRFFVLHLEGRLPAVAIFFIAAIIPFFLWLIIKRSPSLVRQALLGQKPAHKTIYNLRES